MWAALCFSQACCGGPSQPKTFTPCQWWHLSPPSGFSGPTASLLWQETSRDFRGLGQKFTNSNLKWETEGGWLVERQYVTRDWLLHNKDETKEIHTSFFSAITFHQAVSDNIRFGNSSFVSPHWRYLSLVYQNKYTATNSNSPQPVKSQPYPVPIPLPQPKSRPLPDSRGIPDKY